MRPRLKMDYMRGRGVELGATFDLDFDASGAVQGEVRGRGAIFEPPPLKGPSAVGMIVIGGVPVPVLLSMSVSSRTTPRETSAPRSRAWWTAPGAPSVDCWLPRVEVAAMVGGIAEPQMRRVGTRSARGSRTKVGRGRNGGGHVGMLQQAEGLVAQRTDEAISSRSVTRTPVRRRWLCHRRAVREPVCGWHRGSCARRCGR
jgi:hypothetical protein